MMNKIRLITLLIFSGYLMPVILTAHEGHNKKAKMPAIGIVQGTVTDSITGSAIAVSYTHLTLPTILLV